MKTCTYGELSQILTDHHLWVESASSGEQANLSSYNFKNGWLEDKDLGGVIARLTTFDQAKLSRTKFERAFMESASFQQCVCKGTDFYRAMLEGCNFIDADVEGATFSKANLKYTTFSNANLSGADFYQADVQEADLTETSFWEAARWWEAKNLWKAYLPPEMECLSRFRSEEAFKNFLCTTISRNIPPVTSMIDYILPCPQPMTMIEYISLNPDNFQHTLEKLVELMLKKISQAKKATV